MNTRSGATSARPFLVQAHVEHLGLAAGLDVAPGDVLEGDLGVAAQDEFESNNCKRLIKF
jgi:hypothetical protein